MGAGRTFPHILSHLYFIMLCGGSRFLFSEPTKSILVFSAHNLARAERLFMGKGLTIITRVQYLGGYIGYAAPEAQCLVKKVKDWVRGIRTMNKVA